jgi:short-subunit dehydrogenase
MTVTTKPLAVVTGASSGIGRELAGEFARNGFDVFMVAEEEGIVAAARAIEEQEEVTATPVRADLSTYDGVERLCSTIDKLGAPPAALAINAGIGVSGDFARDNSLADELALINLNVTSSVHLAKRLLPVMIDRGEGKVLFTSSVAATGPGPYQATYAASKAFLSSFAEAIRQELKDTGVTVTTLMPGPTDTEFFERADMQDTKLGQMENKDDPADVARQGFEALMKGKDHVVAGSLKNKIQAGASKFAPQQVKAKAQAKLTEPTDDRPST